MKRSDIIKEIMSQLNDDDVVVASTGFISREVFKYDRPLNFYMMGSMGNALAIGIGIAEAFKMDGITKRVIVINGDGSVLMSLGSMITAKARKLNNLVHFILDNGCHESTGGQPTNSNFIEFRNLCRNTLVYRTIKDESVPPRITLRPKEITERFKNALLCFKVK